MPYTCEYGTTSRTEGLVRKETLTNYPELREALAPLGSLIDNSTMRVLNYEVNGNKRDIPELVKEFLQGKKFFE